MENLAPAPVVLAARFDAPEQVGGGADEPIIGALVVQRMGVTPPHVEDLRGGVRVRFAPRTIGPA
jgi:hypothetical protein